MNTFPNLAVAAFLGLQLAGCSFPTQGDPGAAGLASAESFADDWATRVKVGAKGIYGTTVAGGIQVKLEFTVTARDETTITLMETQRMSGKVLKEREKVVKIAEWNLRKALKLSADSELVQSGTETLTLDGKSLECTIWTCVKGKSTVRLWISKDVPRVFKGGLVRSEEREGNESQVLKLESLE